MGKFGSFSSNSLLGRPYYLTYEILDKTEDSPLPNLRIVPASELHADTLLDEQAAGSDSKDDPNAAGDVVETDGKILVRDNRDTIDDSSRQTLTSEEIEELKRSALGSGKDIVTRIMESHSAIGEKTAYSLAKYILRKSKKYMRRFTALPLDVSMLANWMLHERDAGKIFDIREDTLSLIASWSNVHSSIPPPLSDVDSVTEPKAGRWLVFEETAGLIVAMLAERMGILHPPRTDEEDEPNQDANPEQGENDAVAEADAMDIDTDTDPATTQPNGQTHPRRTHPATEPVPASQNTITLIHSANQPNLSLLSYFSYDQNASSSNTLTKTHTHPLYSHLRTVSWLQLLSPTEDSACIEPEALSAEALAAIKPAKRGAYHRKRRRWARAAGAAAEARAGGFDGLIVATPMALPGVMHALLPLVRGGAPVVVYSPSAEPLAELAECYSSARRTAFIGALHDKDDADGEENGNGNGEAEDGAAASPLVPSEDFPVDPRLLLAPTVQTARAREWQVLPGRTHPVMTALGGPEGYLLTGMRVIPSEERAAARGSYMKRKRAKREDEGPTGNGNVGSD